MKKKLTVRTRRRGVPDERELCKTAREALVLAATKSASGGVTDVDVIDDGMIVWHQSGWTWGALLD